VQTSLRGIANKAAKQRKHRFGNLYELLNEENLRWCWQFLRKGAAPGIDRVASIANFTAWIRKERHQRIGRLLATLNSKYRGYWNYYGVIGNSASLQRFFYTTQRLVFKWLNRRSQRRSYTWAGFNALVYYFAVERPRITERAGPVQQMLL
jgi:hypothetical protein